MRKLILAVVSVTALGLGAGVAGAAGINDPVHAPGVDTPDMSGKSQALHNAVNPTANQILQAQQQLRKLGFYDGTVDGILNAKTKQAIDRFQRENGLKQTATLDQATMRSLLESTGRAGSSSPPGSNSPLTNPHPASRGSSRPSGSAAPY